MCMNKNIAKSNYFVGLGRLINFFGKNYARFYIILLPFYAKVPLELFQKLKAFNCYESMHCDQEMSK